MKAAWLSQMTRMVSMIEEAGGHIEVGEAKEIGAGAKGVVDGQQHILAANQKRGEVMRHMVRQRDWQDCRCEPHKQLCHPAPPPGHPVACRDHGCEQTDQQNIGSDQPDDHRADHG